MDADAKFDALVGRDPSVALDHRRLDFNGAAHRVDDAAELDDAAVAGALDDAAVMHGDGRDRSDRCGAPAAAPESGPRPLRRAANSRRRRTPRSPRVFGFRPRRYAAATVSAVSGRPGKASGGHRKDARGMSIIGLSMAVLPCCAEEDVEAGSAAPRVDWPVYPRRAEHNTVAEGGNRRWAEHGASSPTSPTQNPRRSSHGAGDQGSVPPIIEEGEKPFAPHAHQLRLSRSSGFRRFGPRRNTRMRWRALLRRGDVVGQIQNLPLTARFADDLRPEAFPVRCARGRCESPAAGAKHHIADHA